MTKNIYRVPAEVLPLVKHYHDSVQTLIAEKTRMETEFTKTMETMMKQVAIAKGLACNAAASKLGIHLGPEDLYDIDTNYLEALGVAVLQHIPAEEKPKPVATERSQIN